MDDQTQTKFNEIFKLPDHGNYAIEVFDGAFWLTVETGLTFGEADVRRAMYHGKYEKTRVVAISKASK